jgi:putative intracellular protease/amidase
MYYLLNFPSSKRKGLVKFFLEEIALINKRRSIIVLTILSLFLMTAGPISCETKGGSAAIEPSAISEAASGSALTKHWNAIQVPFEFQQIEHGGAGPACLSMLSQFYGDNVNQTEYEEVLFDGEWEGDLMFDRFIVAAEHDGYANRNYGYQVAMYSLAGCSDAEKRDFFQAYVDSGRPLLILTKYYEWTIPAFRIVTGYDWSPYTLICHDTWAWPNLYCGKYCIMSLEPGSFLARVWDNTNYKVMDVRPLAVELDIIDRPAQGGDSIEVGCTVNLNLPEALTLDPTKLYSSPSIVGTDIEVTLELPDGFALTSGSSTVTLNSVSQTASCSWTIELPTSAAIADAIRVVARTVGQSYVVGGEATLFPLAPEDPIISKPVLENEGVYSPCMFNVSGTVDYDGEYAVEAHFFDKSNSLIADSEVVEVGCNTESFCVRSPMLGEDRLVFSWFEVETETGRFLSNVTITETKSTNQVKILFIMDNDYGANYHFIRPILEGWGWEVTLAGTAMTIEPCDYQSGSETLDMDMLISEVSNILDYDAISVMPGNSHEGLLNSQDALNLIKSAADMGIVVSAWCRAVRVLAAADVIDGRNVSGHADYASEYIEAGANYIPGDVPPIIDGNIVTTVRSKFYRPDMCIAIAKAIGVFEEDAPEVTSIRLDPIPRTPDNISNLIVEVLEASGVNLTVASFYTVDPDTGKRDSSEPFRTVTLEYVSGTQYGADLNPFGEGNYTVDIFTRDVFGNAENFTDVLSFGVCYPSRPKPAIDETMLLLLGGSAILGISLIAIAIRFFRKRSV